jgi:hypothetical protein
MAPKTALTRRPSKPQVSTAVPKPQRLSPGVYRGAGGELTNSAGRPLPGGSRPPTMNPGQRGAGSAPMQPTPDMQMPTGVPGGFQQGSGFQQGMGAGLGAAIGAGMDQSRFLQPYPMPQQGGGFGGGFAEGLGGYGKGPAFNQPGNFGPPSQELMDIARQRAEAINRGDMVTMDYNPQREALVDQYLGDMKGGQQYMPGSPDMTATGIANPNPFGGVRDPGYYDQMRQQMEAFRGAQNGAMGGGFGAPPSPMTPPPTQAVTGGMAQGIVSGIGGAPMARPPAPMRPRGDGRDRRFAQPQVRPPAPLPPGTPSGPIATPQRPGGIQGLLRRGR